MGKGRKQQNPNLTRLRMTVFGEKVKRTGGAGFLREKKKKKQRPDNIKFVPRFKKWGDNGWAKSKMGGGKTRQVSTISIEHPNQRT